MAENEEENNPVLKIIGGVITLGVLWGLFYTFFTNSKGGFDKGFNKAIEEETKKMNPIPKLSSLRLESILNDTAWKTSKLLHDLHTFEFEDINHQGDNGITFLIALARSKDFILMDSVSWLMSLQKLLTWEPNFNHTDKNGRTALLWNTIEGCFTWHQEKRMEKRLTKFHNTTTTNKSLSGFHFNYQRFLLDNYSPVDLPDKKGNTPLIIACHFKVIDYVKLLLSHGANPNLKNRFGRSAFDAAGTNTEIINLLNRYKRPE